MPTAVLVSFRLGAPDGVSVESAKWAASLRRQGWQVRTVAGDGDAEIVISGLSMHATVAPALPEVAGALGNAELVVVENLCSLPFNPAAARLVVEVLRGRPAIFHHHDLPWQRSRFAARSFRIADDRHWRHVTINDLSRRQLAQRGIEAVVIRNAFDTDAPPGDRDATRQRLGLGEAELLVMQPTRAIARKNIPAALALAESLGATYWLLGPAEEGYDEELSALLTSAPIRCIHGPAGTAASADIAHAYAAADVVSFPSTWEGFGNPVVESAVWRRPLAIGTYPVASELAAYGFRWLDAADHAAVRAWLDQPDPAWLDHNHAVARASFSLATLDRALGALVAEALDGPRR